MIVFLLSIILFLTAINGLYIIRIAEHIGAIGKPRGIGIPEYKRRLREDAIKGINPKDPRVRPPATPPPPIPGGHTMYDHYIVFWAAGSYHSQPIAGPFRNHEQAESRLHELRGNPTLAVGRLQVMDRQRLARGGGSYPPDQWGDRKLAEDIELYRKLL